MKISYLFSLPLFIILLNCHFSSSQNTSPEPAPLATTAPPGGDSIQSRFAPPAGYQRTAVSKQSFAQYLRKLPLKPAGARVHLYDGSEKIADDVYDAVVDLPIGKRDLHQCADAVMRLRAEYLWNNKRYKEIHFKLTNGFQVDYERWRKGERVKVEGNRCKWTGGGTVSDSYAQFWKYLEFVFTYAGTLSLSGELKSVSVDAIQAGDVFIRGGSPGHAIIVLDVAVNKQGKKCFLLAQSYMPAQEIQVLKNNNDPAMSPWYPVDFGDKLYTPEWTFSRNDLKRFEGE